VSALEDHVGSPSRATRERGTLLFTSLVCYGPEVLPHDFLLIAGHLRYRGVSCRIHALSESQNVERLFPGEQSVALAASKYDREWKGLNELRRFFLQQGTLVALVGREITYQRDRLLNGLYPNEILILGDASVTLFKIACQLNSQSDPVLAFGPLARVILGSPLDPTEFQTPYEHLPQEENRCAVLWSVGCREQCAYCPHGYHFHNVYGDDYSVRRRDIDAVVSDIQHFAAKGCRHVRLIADQVLEHETSSGEALSRLCESLHGRVSPDTVIEVMLSTRDVADNRELLARCSRLTNLYVLLKVDFASDDLLGVFSLPMTKQTHIDALRILHECQIRFELNYIFFQPLLTEVHIREMLELLLATYKYFAHNPLPFAYYLINQILLTSLANDPVAPIPVEQAGTQKPSKRVLNFYICMLEALERYETLFALYIIDRNLDGRRLLNAFFELIDLTPECDLTSAERSGLIAKAFRQVTNVSRDC
jgi:hypothetical protein